MTLFLLDSSASSGMRGRPSSTRRYRIAMFQGRDLHVHRMTTHVLRGIDIDIPQGCFAALIGPNGSGKSTLLGALAGLLPPSSGRIEAMGRATASLKPREFARLVSYLPQDMPVPPGLSVRELVVQGRFPWRGWFGGWSARDENALRRAVDLCGIEALLDRPLSSLSGGQLQRARIAMTLAQETPILLLDEPTTFLDIAHQLSLLELLLTLRDAGHTIVAVLHDLNQAARYADRLVMLREGRVVAQGETTTVFDAANIEAVFGVRSRMVADPQSGGAICIPFLQTA